MNADERSHAEPIRNPQLARRSPEHSRRGEGGSAIRNRESLCRRCARCCYEKYVVEERVFTTRRPCSCLDVKTRFCRVYETRFQDNFRCVPVEEGIRLGVFPADCPYVQGMEGYVPSEEGWLDEEVVALIERGTLLTAEDVRAEMRRRSKHRGSY